MTNKTKYLLFSTALVACVSFATPSFSTTVVRETVIDSPDNAVTKKTVTEISSEPEAETTTTVETTMPATGTNTFRFLDFDLNGDGILSVNEIGKMLFKLYDTDGNGLIDNNEYERRAVITVVPMEKNTVVSYDFDGDGHADVRKYTYQTFMQETMLTRFDKNRDGLSPREFTNRGFMAADVNHDKGVDLQEWQGTYISSLDKQNKEKSRLNK